MVMGADIELAERPALRVIEGGKSDDKIATLTDGEADAIGDFFLTFEGRIGMRSSHESQRAVWASGGGSRSCIPSDPGGDAIDRSDVKGANKVYRALRRMIDDGDSFLVTVLWLSLGPWQPQADAWTLRDRDTAEVRDLGVVRIGFEQSIARLVPLTATASDERDAMALDESDVREQRTSDGFSENREARQDELAEEFWRAATRATELDAIVTRRLAKADAGIGRYTTEEAARRTNDLEARRVAWWEVMRKTLDAYGYDGALGARLSAIASADRETTVAAAIVRRLRRPHPAGFIADATKDVERLRSDAAKAYRAARRALQ